MSPSLDWNQFRRAVFDHMAAQGLNQAGISRQSGVNKVSLSRLRGGHRLDAGTAYALCLWMGCDMALFVRDLPAALRHRRQPEDAA